MRLMKRQQLKRNWNDVRSPARESGKPRRRWSYRRNQKKCPRTLLQKFNAHQLKDGRRRESVTNLLWPRRHQRVGRLCTRVGAGRHVPRKLRIKSISKEIDGRRTPRGHPTHPLEGRSTQTPLCSQDRLLTGQDVCQNIVFATNVCRMKHNVE